LSAQRFPLDHLDLQPYSKRSAQRATEIFTAPREFRLAVVHEMESAKRLTESNKKVKERHRIAAAAQQQRDFGLVLVS
jgi:hypothetical protein